MSRSLTAPALALLAGCTGTIFEPPPVQTPPVTPTVELPTTAIPRQSRRELEAQLFDVFGLSGAATRNLPPDAPMAVNPTTLAEEEVFDTLADAKEPSEVFVEGLEGLALELGRAMKANPAKVRAISGCTPSGTAVDEACLAAFVDALAPRLWRRAISVQERDALVQAITPIANTARADAHGFAVQAVVMALVSSPELAYRTELGTPVEAGVVRLTDGELVARLAAFLWGAAPTPELLARASSGALDDAAVATLVDEMLADPRAREQQRVFHQLWLRYEGLLVTDTALATDMLAETSALVDRSLATAGTPWTTLFTSTQTYVTPRLAAHYGLSVPPSASWVDTAAPRAGVLSHGSFLSLSLTKGSDTLPSRRGAMLGRRVLCQQVLPPPKDVNIDNGVEVPAGACKTDAYAAHRSRGTCAGCHVVMDGLGFGFERLDGLGRYRETELDRPECRIEGAGTFRGTAFSGPRELVGAQLLAITSCGVTQLARFAFRDRRVTPELVQRLQDAFTASSFDFQQLMRALALDPRFRVRVAEGGSP